MEQDATTVKLNIGNRQDFDRIEFSNAAGLKLALYKNGGTIGLYLDGLMINQLEGHPLQGGLDRVYLRKHTVGAVEPLLLSGTAAPCSFHNNGAVWRQDKGGVEASVQLMLHPDLPLLFRVCRAHNNGAQAVTLDWMAGQDLGLSDTGMLKNNEAYVCQYLDHRIAEHSVTGKVLLTRNNLHPTHPFAVNCCLQGAQSASSDGYQFFGTASKLSGKAVALDSTTLQNRV
ncbi:MAG TPA: hypothetical protein VIV27_02755, partial [Halioglobus sp.]